MIMVDHFHLALLFHFVSQKSLIGLWGNNMPNEVGHMIWEYSVE